MQTPGWLKALVKTSRHETKESRYNPSEDVKCIIAISNSLKCIWLRSEKRQTCQRSLTIRRHIRITRGSCQWPSGTSRAKSAESPRARSPRLPILPETENLDRVTRTSASMQIQTRARHTSVVEPQRTIPNAVAVTHGFTGKSTWDRQPCVAMQRGAAVGKTPTQMVAPAAFSFVWACDHTEVFCVFMETTTAHGLPDRKLLASRALLEAAVRMTSGFLRQCSKALWVKCAVRRNKEEAAVALWLIASAIADLASVFEPVTFCLWKHQGFSSQAIFLPRTPQGAFSDRWFAKFSRNEK